MLDILSFFIISGLIFIVVTVTMPTTPDLFMIIAFLFLIIPTVVALIQGAPFVPTPMKAAKKLINISGIKKGDKVIDIGCGDGRLVYLAAKEKEADSTGFELSPLVYALAKIRQLLWKSKAKIKFGDFRMFDLSTCDFIVCYMLPETLNNFVPKFEKDMKKGAKIVSYAFQISRWKPVSIIASDPGEAISRIYIYEIGKQYKN
ncbi:class I SAM-dependent methyltransferase [Candidatus Peregrinibacteria bacterium]|nr:class I SAM-dependent methyltransferase [Candidatus Peregrinibacteria bacterium]